ncbi:hypothetical protein CSA57_03735 [candidate division KSB3 bacterium]|nr:MAG: hypothetical protein CSA57_03735 [candidate division KSB3 bacterium]
MIIAFHDPYYGVLSYTLANIIRPEQLMWGDKSAAGRIYLMTQLVCFISWLINKNSEKLTPAFTPVSSQQKIFWLLAIGMSIVSAFSLNKNLSWMWTISFWKMTLYTFVMAKSINSAKKFELYYAMSLVLFTLLAIWGIQQKFGGNTRMEGLGGEQLSDINDISSVYVMLFPMTYYFLFSRKKWIRVFVAIPSFLVFTIFILFGGSRGAFLGLIGVMGYIFIRSPFTQKIKMLGTLVLVGGVLIGVLINLAPEGFFDEYTKRLSTIFGKEDVESGEVEREGSSAGRIAMWKGALQVYRTQPQYWVTGVGMRVYPHIYARHFDVISEVLDPEEFALIYHEGKGGKAIHNTQINVLVSGGLLVFPLWCILIAFVWLQLHFIPRRYPRIVDGINIHSFAMALEAGLVGWIICMTFLNLELVDFFYWHLAMGGIVANLGKAKLRREAMGEEDGEEEIMFGQACKHLPESFSY